MKRVIITADDFGLSESVNEAVEIAHRDGILGTASLMVAGPAAADAVRRARRLPDLRVGLHVVVVDGPATLPGAVPHLVDETGRFSPNQTGLGFIYGLSPRAWRQLRMEIAAQYRAFAATGLMLDHVNAHKHMHLHPVVARIMIEEGANHGVRAMRIPAEPPHVIRACGTRQGPAATALYRWTQILRRQGRRAGLHMNDHCFGLAWTGHMTAHHLINLAPQLPDGLSEIYFHPAAAQDARLASLMPNYEHEAELAALIDPACRTALASAGAIPARFSAP